MIEKYKLMKVMLKKGIPVHPLRTPDPIRQKLKNQASEFGGDSPWLRSSLFLNRAGLVKG